MLELLATRIQQLQEHEILMGSIEILNGLSFADPNAIRISRRATNSNTGERVLQSVQLVCCWKQEAFSPLRSWMFVEVHASSEAREEHESTVEGAVFDGERATCIWARAVLRRFAYDRHKLRSCVNLCVVWGVNIVN